MPSYWFSLDHCIINHIRSAHNDTLYVSFTLKVGDQEPQTVIRALGDVQKGWHEVGLKFENVEIGDPSTPVIFNYTFINAGHAAWQDINRVLTEGAGKLAKGEIEKLNLPDFGGKVDMKGLAQILLDLGLQFLNADCDGTVATDQIAVTRAQLDQWNWNSGAHDEDRTYAGYDSPAGCGRNSEYVVHWILGGPDHTGPEPQGSRTIRKMQS